MNKEYETMLILPPNLGEKDLDETIETIQKELTDRFGAENLAVDRWGKQNLAYPIRRFNEGYYVLFNYESGRTDTISGLESRLRLNESVMRFLTIRRDEEHRSEARMKARYGKRKNTGDKERSDNNDDSDSD
ncbi:MAG: 30S ribosomal protein S6 [Acidobacteriota bacterium]